MKIKQPITKGRLQKRYKRFLADVEVAPGEVVTAHCPNTGSLTGCLPENAPCVLRDSQDPKRKLRYTLQTIQVDGTWVNVDTGLPNKLVPEAIRAGLIPALRGYPTVSTEVKYGASSRIDVLLEGADGSKCYVEVNNTTLMRGKRALFPDAITSRGRKHLLELIDMVHEGHRAMMFYCVSRADATSFGPATEVDPAYCETLLEAVRAGVELQAWSTLVHPKSFELGKRLRIHLPG